MIRPPTCPGNRNRYTYVLEGSVRRSGDDLRITAQLIDARTDEHLWAERYEGTLDNVFKIQEEASQAILEALDVKINPGEIFYFDSEREGGYGCKDLWWVYTENIGAGDAPRDGH